MFVENTMHSQTGWIEFITGPMFSGKTEELIRRVKRAMIGRLKVAIFKPSIDSRYSDEYVVSHDDNSLTSIKISDVNDILLKAQGADVVAIDEVQFFSDEIVKVTVSLANKGLRVICAGLDMDYSGKPFGPVPDLLSVADHVTKVHAICIKCGRLAHFSHRKNSSRDLVQIGEKDNYEPLCRECFVKATSH